MASGGIKYFYEDEVFRVTKKGTLQFGMVIEDAEDASSDDEPSSDEDEQPVKAGQIRVAWYPVGTEQVVSERKVQLVDRSLMPGDVVRRLECGKLGTQRGYCRDVAVYSSVQVIGTNQVIYGVKSSLLTPLETFKSDVLVCLDGWVGMVRNVKAKITLSLPDSSKVVVDEESAQMLDDIQDRRDPECEFKRYDFYPGQILFGPIRCLETGQWMSCSTELLSIRKQKPHKTFKVTVEDINFESLNVNWICRAYFSSSTPGEKTPQPKFKVEGDNRSRIKMLNVFEPCTLQIGDRNFYTIKEDDLVMMKREWKKLQKIQLLKVKSDKMPKVPKADSNDVLKVNDEKENSSDYEDVDDGDTASVSSHDSEINNINSIQKKNKGKTQPGLMTNVLKRKQKLKKSKNSNSTSQMILVKSGDKLVVETLSTKSEVDVVWQDGTCEKGIPSKELYPVHHLDENEFFPGDYVTEAKDGFHPHSYGVIQDVDHAGRCCRVKWFRTYTEGCQPQPMYVSTTDISVYDLKDHPDFKFRPGSIVIRVMNNAGDDCGLGAGQVLDNQPSGQVSVWWAGENVGVKTDCWPQDLYRVGEYDSDEGELWEDDDDDEEDGNESWETEEEIEGFDENIKDEDLHTDEKDLKPKLAENIEKTRVAMGKLEEMFGTNPCLQTPEVMKQVLDVFKDCRTLDRLMETDYFDESHFSGLLEKVRDKDRIFSVETAVKEQVSRLFSTGNGSEIEDRESGVEITDVEDIPDNKVCGQLCSLIKSQLLLSHKEMVVRFGPVAGETFEEDLDTEVARLLKDRNFVPGAFRVNSDNILVLSDNITDHHQDEVKEDSTNNDSNKDDVFNDDKKIADTEDLVEVSPINATSRPLVPGSFQIMDIVPDSHKFKLTIFQPSNMRSFLKHVKMELDLLQSSLPVGISVKGYEDRMDLYSVMIHGPTNTPYEDGLFFFDIQLSGDYPTVPPTFHYISYCSDRLNPNLYEDGKVCVSLLGTWAGKGTETWTSSSNILQVLISIQGLILVSEPYYNEAGYEKQRGTQQGWENSRMYNEMAVLKLVQSMTRMISNPHPAFSQEIRQHFKDRASFIVDRLVMWKNMSQEPPSIPCTPTVFTQMDVPDFPLIPASKGFCLTLQRNVDNLQSALGEI